MNYNDYYQEIENDIRAEFGDSAISNPKTDNRMSWKEAIEKYNSLTPEEREALSLEVAKRKGWA